VTARRRPGDQEKNSFLLISCVSCKKTVYAAAN